MQTIVNVRSITDSSDAALRAAEPRAIIVG